MLGSSLTAVVLFGTAVGNCLSGLPIGSDGELRVGFFDLLRPYPLLVAVFAVVFTALHGALFLGLKTDGPLRERLRGWSWRLFGLFLVTYLLTTIFTLVRVPRSVENFTHLPWAWAIGCCAQAWALLRSRCASCWAALTPWKALTTFSGGSVLLMSTPWISTPEW